MGVMVAGAWVLDAWFSTGAIGVRIARVLYGLALIPFGLAHLLYVKETAALVPAWIPAHLFWVYATATAIVAAGTKDGFLPRLAGRQEDDLTKHR